MPKTTLRTVWRFFGRADGSTLDLPPVFWGGSSDQGEEIFLPLSSRRTVTSFLNRYEFLIVSTDTSYTSSQLNQNNLIIGVLQHLESDA